MDEVGEKKLAEKLDAAWKMTYNPGLCAERSAQIRAWGKQFAAAAGRFFKKFQEPGGPTPSPLP